MTEQKYFLNAKEFSQKTGIPSSTVSKLLRAGKINGQKKSGKWVIPISELEATAVLHLSGDKPAEAEAPQTAPVSSKTYSVAEFSRMTYLTEKGVIEWLKKGRLKGKMISPGDWQVDAANLDAPGIQRLVREGR